MPITVDDYAAELRRLGWSAGDVLVHSEDGSQWMVYAHRGEERIVAKARSQTDAWREASRLASTSSP
jgi:hypothetical protein